MTEGTGKTTAEELLAEALQTVEPPSPRSVEAAEEASGFRANWRSWAAAMLAASPALLSALEGNERLREAVKAALTSGGIDTFTDAADAAWSELRAALLATPATPPEPSGDPEYMCPNCLTPWKCNGPHIAIEAEAVAAWLQSPEAEQRLAAALRSECGFEGPDVLVRQDAIRILAALREQP